MTFQVFTEALSATGPLVLQPKQLVKALAEFPVERTPPTVPSKCKWCGVALPFAWTKCDNCGGRS